MYTYSLNPNTAKYSMCGVVCGGGWVVVMCVHVDESSPTCMA